MKKSSLKITKPMKLEKFALKTGKITSNGFANILIIYLNVFVTMLFLINFYSIGSKNTCNFSWFLLLFSLLNLFLFVADALDDTLMYFVGWSIFLVRNVTIMVFLVYIESFLSNEIKSKGFLNVSYSYREHLKFTREFILSLIIIFLNFINSFFRFKNGLWRGFVLNLILSFVKIQIFYGDNKISLIIISKFISPIFYFLINHVIKMYYIKLYKALKKKKIINKDINEDKIKYNAIILKLFVFFEFLFITSIENIVYDVYEVLIKETN